MEGKQVNTTQQPENLVNRAAALATTLSPTTRRERGPGCDGNHRVTDDTDSMRNRFYAAYRAVRFSRRFGG